MAGRPSALLATAAALTAGAVGLGAVLLGAAAPAAALRPTDGFGRTAQAAKPPLPERVKGVGGSRQVIVATAADWYTSHARLQAWQRGDDGTWRRVMRPVAARVGWDGFEPRATRRQGSGETPAGTFRLLRGFGLAKPAGVELRYRLLRATDWWPYDPNDAKTYNVFQFGRPAHARWRTSWAEDLDSYRKQYRYAVILDYNLPSGVHWRNGQRVAAQQANTRKGGGIFLHVKDDGPTAGCIAVSPRAMRWLLRWLDPGDRPVIAMGPPSAIFGR